VKSDTANLATILERIERARRFTREGRSVFLRDEMVQDAVIRELEVIGEATKRLSISTRRLDSSIPWTKIAGFKDVAIHQYDRLNLESVWRIVVDELPSIELQVRRILVSVRTQARKGYGSDGEG
jgi:uncharacterized protein with HEPN domain